MRSRQEVSDDERLRIVQAYSRGSSIKTIAQVTGRARSTIYGIIATYLDESRLVKKRRGGPRPRKIDSDHAERIRSWVDTDCSISLKEMKTRCQEELQLTVSTKTIDRCLRSFHYSMKRTTCLPARRNDERALEASRI